MGRCKRLRSFVIFIIVGFLLVFAKYMAEEMKKIRLQIKWLENVMVTEKNWILENQGTQGEIYMNGQEAGNVDPYFSCMAAIGLLSKTRDIPVSQKEYIAVRRYLDWHTKELLKTEGRMGIYQKTEKGIVRVGKADSEDGYLGVYLELLGRYLQETGYADQLENWEEGAALAVERIRFLMKDGTTQVSPENPTVYLMDNLDVWKGLYEFEKSGFAADLPVSRLRSCMEEKIQDVFWNEETHMWRINKENNNYDNRQFYPDGVAQIYPLIRDFPVTKEQKKSYGEFTEEFRWQELNKYRDGFAWTMTGMAAAAAQDAPNLEKMLKNYESTYRYERDYPLYTGEAGWVCLECESLYQMVANRWKFL